MKDVTLGTRNEMVEIILCVEHEKDLRSVSFHRPFDHKKAVLSSESFGLDTRIWGTAGISAPQNHPRDCIGPRAIPS